MDSVGGDDGAGTSTATRAVRWIVELIGATGRVLTSHVEGWIAIGPGPRG